MLESGLESGDEVEAAERGGEINGQGREVAVGGADLFAGQGGEDREESLSCCDEIFKVGVGLVELAGGVLGVVIEIQAYPLACEQTQG